MKIGIDCRIFSSKFTGIGRYTHELVENFIRINQEIAKPHQLVLFFNEPEYHDFRNLAPIKKVLVNSKHYSLSEQTHFLFKLLKENCDTVHFPHFNIPILYNKPYTVTIHDLTLSLFPGQKMTKWYHRLAYNFTIKNAVKKAKKIIAVSEHTKSDLIKILKVPSKKITVIYHGLNPNFTFLKNPRPQQKTLAKYHIKKPFLLYTGVWRNHKNLPRLIKAFHIIKKSLDLTLVITGKSDPHYPEILDTIQELNLQKDIVFPGLVEENELVHLYNAASIFVFPSLYEGFGFPPLEAMGCGTPVAASNNSSIPEICGKHNAVYFDPYSIEDIAEKIKTLYKDTDLQAQLRENGLQHVKKFSWETMAQNTFKLSIAAANDLHQTTRSYKSRSTF